MNVYWFHYQNDIGEDQVLMDRFAIEVSLILKMSRLNGVAFEIDQIDLQNQEVLLIKG